MQLGIQVKKQNVFDDFIAASDALLDHFIAFDSQSKVACETLLTTSPIAKIEKQTREMIEQFGTTNYIANLGHGILPNIPVDHAKAFVDTVKSYQPRRY